MFVHSSRIQKQIEYLSSLGVDVNPIYKQTDIKKEDVLKPEKTFDFEQYKMVLEFALRQTKNPHYGLDFGNQPQLGGTIGMMCASCENMEEALKRGCEFFKIQGDFAELHFVDDKAKPKLVYNVLESWVMVSAQTAKLEVDAMFSFLNTILKINSNNTLRPKNIRMVFSKPENTGRYVEVFGIAPEFDSEQNEIVFEKSSLLIPMKAFNPETYKLLNSHLQFHLSKIGRSETTTEKVKRILHASFKYQFPDIDDVAGQLNLSSRTLQRKLSDEQTTFQNILLNAKFGIAKKLLEQGVLTISEISYTLGYSDLGNFSRSFKKHVGVSPQEYRDQYET